MKKVLFFALMAAAVLGCKRSPEVDPNEGPTAGQVIALTSGEVTISRADPTANEGTRVHFAVGDQIGVFAAYGNKENPDPHTGPDWADAVAGTEFKGRYFDNAPAACATAGTESAPAKFTWGPAGEGGVAHEQLYPKKDRAIFAYAYYPLVKADSIVMDPTDGPKVSYILDTITPLNQPDILWSIGKSKATPTALDSVTRQDPLGVLKFEHALSQINFVLYKKDEAVAVCKLVDIKLTVPATGTVTLSAASSNVELVASNGKSRTGTYTIVAGTDNVENGTVNKWDGTTADARPIPVLTVPYMIWPLTAEQAQKCKLVVRLFFGAGEPEENDPNMRSYPIDMTKMKGIVQGKLNHFILGVTPTVVTLEGQIAPWGADGQDSDLSIE